MQFIEHLIESIRGAGVNYNPDIQTAPACILWTDSERRWEAVIQTLLSELPELFILGEYNPEKRTGPAIWLRCVVANRIDDFKLPSDRKPIIYLPGVSRHDLRAVENLPENLKPLAELQYRGVIWSQVNSKDWTVFAVLKSDQGGLGLDVALDNDTKKAMLRALESLLYRDIERFKGKKLDKDFFNNLIAGDYIRHLLQWLDQGDAIKSDLGENKWQALVEMCKSQLIFNPEKDGILTGATKLASHLPQWNPVWERFCEAPKRYPNIPDHIRKCNPPKSISWWNPGHSEYDRWPQWNEEQENNLRKKLEALNNMPPHKAREHILELEKDHGLRRNFVWAELGESQLAKALEHLSVLAHITTKALAAGNIADLETGYQNKGWQADNAVMMALSLAKNQEDLKPITTAIRAVYKPWAEESARYLQKIVNQSGYPGGNLSNKKIPKYTRKECILFVDGLRFDAAKRLVKLLEDQGFQIKEKVAWAPLPSVTATGKPSVTPVHGQIGGQDTTTDFEPCVAESGKSLKGGYQLKKLLSDAGWEILNTSSKTNGSNNAWYEFGDIDHEGHQRGWKLAKYLDTILGDIRDRVMQLFEADWKIIRIVTDHGWLLLPGNLPKIELPSAQTETKWGRCAIIKPGASTDERLYSWYWNPNVHFALADGISCFRKGLEYDHGGLSLQECLTLELIVTSGSLHTSHIAPVITDVTWKGLRCAVTVDGIFEELILDIRTQPGNPSSSVVYEVKTLKNKGTASVVVENEDLEGMESIIVLINQEGELVAQINTTIGGEQK